jgi:hypothetical protein
MSLVAVLVGFGVLVAIQGALLQVSCAMVGEQPPRYGDALGTALVAGLASAVLGAGFGCTAGLLIRLFLGQWAAWLGSALFGVAVSASIYRSRLLLDPGRALQIAAVHHVLAWLVAAAVWAVLRFVV